MDSIVFLTSLAARFALSRASLLFARLARDSSRFSRALAAASSSPVFCSKRFTLLTRTFAGRPGRFVGDRFVIAADPAPDVVAAERAAGVPLRLEDAASGDLIAFLHDALDAADTRSGKEAAN
jgi:hypothetical protein